MKEIEGAFSLILFHKYSVYMIYKTVKYSLQYNKRIAFTIEAAYQNNDTG